VCITHVMQNCQDFRDVRIQLGICSQCLLHAVQIYCSCKIHSCHASLETTYLFHSAHALPRVAGRKGDSRPTEDPNLCRKHM
jgi:hypothetical protein